MLVAKNITSNIVRKCRSRFFTAEISNTLQLDAKHAMPSNGTPAEVRLQVLGCGSRAGSTSLILITDRKRYMFNCGEGTQRLTTEHKTKLAKIERIFITSGIWKNVGGLPGVIFTIQGFSDEMKDDCYINVTNITAPRKTKQMLQILKDSNIMKKLYATFDEPETFKQYDDNVMTVSCIPIYSNVNDISSKCISETIINNSTDNGSIIYANTDGKRKTNEIRTDKRIKLNTNDPPVLCYICKLKDKPGTLSLEKCLAKGIKPGPILGLLKNGENVTLDDGTIVRNDEVCSPKKKGPTFVVVDCPNEKFLESFVNEAAFVKHQKNASDENDKPYCIIHFTPQEIIDNPKYKEWMNNFDSNTYHLIINESNTCLGSEAVYKQQHTLNLLNPKIFPFLESKCFQNESTVNNENLNTDNNQRIHYAKTLQTIEFRPEKKFHTDTKIFIDRKIYTNQLLEIEYFSTMLEELRSNIDEQTSIVLDTEEYPKFVMLGTGSSIPSKVRNTSAIFVRINESSSILLDCSEGTLSQIARVYGLAKLNHILSTIKAIYVSHMHADHHLGLIGIILARAKVTKEPIFLLMPDTLKSWMNYCYERYDTIKKYVKYISNGDLLAHKVMRQHTILMKQDLCEKLNIKKLETTLVRHCNLSYGIALTFENDKKVVYSGDTMPCNSIIQLGMNCDLLIHEATLQDELIKEAEKKKHSTVSAAISAGEKMQSGFTLLTHFSQRNAKMPVIPEKSKYDLSKVGIAFDYMHFTLSQMKDLPILYPYLKTLYQEKLTLAEERLLKKLQNEFS
ncbi:PREDICTED: ribonuclease Z, mitochondrial [Polistes canadensis]|uniref:ribonuclease Z, mitochondrial n=1 Tax=Polistes canadensis TaxID=91411 RepID=UPI000718C25D|nr:PREDICTED: ribonuclease Z, mitochondrial [Polistes canadensis]